LKKVGAYLLVGTALLACPCHLVFLLPAALGLLGGTALGAALEASTGLVAAAATVYFVGALAGGIYLMNRRARSEKEGSPVPSSAGRKAGALISGAPLVSDSRRAQAGARDR
jgi:mercuric ion transport protein